MPSILSPSSPVAASEIITRVKRTFGDETGAQIEDADILRWANDGQLDIARKTQCLILTEYYNTGIGTYELTPPNNFLYFVRAVCNGRLLSPINYQSLDSLHPDRHVSYPTGKPEYLSFMGSKFHLYPAPDVAGTNNLSITFVARPAALSSGTSTLEIPSQFYETLVRFCLMRAKELNEDWSAAEIFRKSYEDEINGIFHEVHNPDNATYPSVRDADGDYY